MGAIGPNDIDLTTLDAVKVWAGVNNALSDDVIQAVITAFSQYVIDYTGVQSFTSISEYVDILDGNGSDRIFVRNRPIREIQQVLVDGVNRQVSAGYNQAGCFIDQSGNSISIRVGGGSNPTLTNTYPGRGSNLVFSTGRGNVLIKYLAGFMEVPFDLELTARRVSAVNYKRTLWIDIVSKMQAVSGGQETVMKFRDWAMPPEDVLVLNVYKRLAPVG